MSIFGNDRYYHRGRLRHARRYRTNISDRREKRLAQSSLLFRLLLQKLARDVHRATMSGRCALDLGDRIRNARLSSTHPKRGNGVAKGKPENQRNRHAGQAANDEVLRKITVLEFSRADQSLRGN